MLLAAYDDELRAHVHDRLPDSIRMERDGPLLRTIGFGNRGWVEYRDLAGLDGEELDELIAIEDRRGDSHEPEAGMQTRLAFSSLDPPTASQLVEFFALRRPDR
jgi:hypothetical protein